MNNYHLAVLSALLLCPPVTAGVFLTLRQLAPDAGAEFSAVPPPVSPVALFPEDGSRTMKAWYTSFSGGHPSAALRRALAADQSFKTYAAMAFFFWH
ncbi:MAG: hypothetical protein A2285_01625 [Elusimicrobia bacterium RIFOXYA12_FULL_57_11]|nr:MAG: hypothetical protein A2285_01625 [Elusimicrobia bacterium RIFOXYA12_FULL_57_11]